MLSRHGSLVGSVPGNRDESSLRGGFVFRSTSALLAIFLIVAVLPGDGPPLAASPAADELVALAKSGGKPLIADFGLGFCM